MSERSDCARVSRKGKDLPANQAEGRGRVALGFQTGGGWRGWVAESWEDG